MYTVLVTPPVSPLHESPFLLYPGASVRSFPLSLLCSSRSTNQHGRTECRQVFAPPAIPGYKYPRSHLWNLFLPSFSFHPSRQGNLSETEDALTLLCPFSPDLYNITCLPASRAGAECFGALVPAMQDFDCSLLEASSIETVTPAERNSERTSLCQCRSCR
jgi:hypothetical protein